MFVASGPTRLRFDKRRKDRYDRFLAYVYVEERMLNVELVRAGLARVSTFPGDSPSLASQLGRAEQDARRAGRGIWSVKEYEE
jgi:micrococcal nuclease